jgi:hypothetical protein
VSDPGDTRAQRPSADEPFLERWSRRKQQAREGIDEEAAAPGPVEAEATPAAPGAPDAPAAVPELPDLDSLGEDSDYSAFMTPGVDPSLRRQALRKLFSSPKFNVCDGLDDYCEDFTQWVPLGDVITADMRHHLERAAKLAEQLAEAGENEAAGGRAPEAAAAASADTSSAEGDRTEDPAGEETERDA